MRRLFLTLTLLLCCMGGARAESRSIVLASTTSTEQSGLFDYILPLFRAAGGRMVGWWKTLIGDLYEQVTIWEYDDMAAFEKAIGFLGPNPQFAEFVALRDPLLAGEENRFLRPAAHAVAPQTAFAGKALLGLMAQPQPDGSSVVEVPLTLKDRTLLLGRLPLARLPELVWPTGTAP